MGDRVRRLVVRGGVAFGAVGLAAATVVATGASASAAEIVTPPANGVLQVAGHGFGHGHGLSQWGAYGAATKGLTYQQILAFYYPGTTLGTLRNSAIDVRVTSDTDGASEVLAQAGLKATSGGVTAELPTHSLITRWRVTSASGYHLQYYNTNTKAWRDWDLTGHEGPVPGPVTLSNASGKVRLLLPAKAGDFFREYLGSVTGTRYNSVHYSVVTTPMETYLRGVVPNEMPASWSAEALRAQAVAARTYAGYERADSPSGRPYETCDSTACQVFDGYIDYTLGGAVQTRHTDSRSDAAIAATVNSSKVPRVVIYAGKLAFTQFSASNGGYMTAGTVPYLVTKRDPYDGVVASNAHSWTDSVSLSTIEHAYPSVGRLTSIVVARDGHGEWGGRADTVTLVGTSGRLNVDGTEFASKAGFLHRWWAPRFAPPARDLTADGEPDLVARVAATGQLRVYPGSGTRLTSPVQLGTGWNGMTAIQASGDYDGDGVADVLAVQRSTGILWLYPGQGNGQLGPRAKMGTGWNVLSAVTAVGDLSGDGQPDVVGIASNGRLMLYAGTGSGRLAAGVVAGTGWSGFDRLVGIGDVDGDGHADLVGRVAASGRLAFYYGNGAGRFRSGSEVTGRGWNSMSMITAAGDLSGDGRPDLLAVERATGTLWRYAGNGSTVSTRASVGNGWNAISALG